MMDFGRYKLSFNDARIIIDNYDGMTDTEFNDQIRHWAVFDVPETEYDSSYKAIRESLISTFRKALDDDNKKITYHLDLEVGIRLYELLNPQTGFSNVIANDDDVWRYITVKVMPDITFIRYPNRQADVDIICAYIPGLSYAIGVKTEKDSIRMKKKRFYSHTRRIWLKTLWWYIHLGWQGTPQKTYEVLKNNGTNIISHFIERPGRGYRESLFRYMLLAYSRLPDQKDSIFRAAAKLNLVNCVSIEPALTSSGEKGYSKELFEEVYRKETAQHNVKGRDKE